MKRARVLLIVLGTLLLLGSIGVAQRRGSAGRGRDNRAVETAREMPSELEPPAAWTNTPGFSKDVFTFVRIKYHGHRRGRWGSGAGFWEIDAPDSDLNFSFRLQQMTSLKVDPNGRFLEITDPALFDFPWIYIVEPGGLIFLDEEVPILRRYLLNGGFLMVDDFWGEAEWENFEREIKRIFPEREIVDLDLDHPIFHCVFEIKAKHQIPNVRTGTWSERTGITWETPDSKEVHYRAINDDKGRMMVMICHNTDLGDGWEREGENEYYFREFSEKAAYPLGINIVFYAMTH
jgi:hypothetical protein